MRHSVAIGVAVGSSMSTTSVLVEGRSGPDSPGNLSVSTSQLSRSSGRVRAAQLEQLREALSERDWAVARDVEKLRLITGSQLERLHFAGLTEASGPVVRRRVLGRLVRGQVLQTLPRRIGGVKSGSDGWVYHLDTAGQRLLAPAGRSRRLDPPGERFVRHVLAVSELYVRLIQEARERDRQIEAFQAEPACWWSDGRGGILKPDAYVAVAGVAHLDHWWVEVDLSTEHLPTIRRKLMAYVSFYRDGQLGPQKVMPWVMVTVLDQNRYSQIVRLIRQLPSLADELFTVALYNDAADLIMRRLSQS